MFICRLEAIASETKPFPVTHFPQNDPPTSESVLNPCVPLFLSFSRHDRPSQFSVFELNSLSTNEIASTRPLQSKDYFTFLNGIFERDYFLAFQVLVKKR